MKLLLLHCDYVKFKPLKKALKNPEELTEERKTETKIEETLVVLTAIEKQDERNSNLIESYIKEIEDVASQIGVRRIVLYPYAHLSSSLANPDFALRRLIKAEEKLKEKGFEVYRAPFGYYKEFELKCKGHPLSELSREIKTQEETLESSEEQPDPKQLLREISRAKLDTKELKENDHRILGLQMDLFSFNDVAPGMIFWHPKGLIMRNELIRYWREEHEKAGYKEIFTPQILDKRLWLISGHWEKYKENMFLTQYEGRDFAIKPMNCPGGILVYKSRTRSYKELPLRLSELGIVHRQELSGVVTGMFRAIQFTQDDAHIFCTEEQLESEIEKIAEMIDRFYEIFNFEYKLELSTRPEKRIGDEALWDKAESTLKMVLNNLGVEYKINEGEGAFYGPKIDYHIKDSLGREWQLATIQLDFSMPERFDLTYIDRDNKEKRPIMIHRVVYGSIERFIAILLEHYNGRLPIWLAPTQVRIINFTDRNNEACQELYENLIKEGIRADLDLKTEPLEGKIKQAEIEKIPLIVVIGDREEKEGTLAVRKKGKVEIVKKEEFLKELKELIANKSS